MTDYISPTSINYLDANGNPSHIQVGKLLNIYLLNELFIRIEYTDPEDSSVKLVFMDIKSRTAHITYHDIKYFGPDIPRLKMILDNENTLKEIECL